MDNEFDIFEKTKQIKKDMMKYQNLDEDIDQIKETSKPIKEHPNKPPNIQHNKRNILMICLCIIICTSMILVYNIIGLNKQLKKQRQQIEELNNQLQINAETLNQLIPSYQSMVSETKNIYLTFDDGPTANTKEILDVLDHYQIKATFFVVGSKDPALYKEIVDRGHQIALHSFSHDYSKIYSSSDAFFEDLYQLQNEIESATGYKPRLFRFAGGSSNTIASKEVIDEILQRAHKEGFVYFDWNCDSQDSSQATVDVETIIEETNRCAVNSNNVVVLMHDSQTKTTMKDALPQIIDYYQKKGFVFRGLTLLTPLIQHRTN